MIVDASYYEAMRLYCEGKVSLDSLTLIPAAVLAAQVDDQFDRAGWIDLAIRLQDLVDTCHAGGIRVPYVGRALGAQLGSLADFAEGIGFRAEGSTAG
jgi:hypothetical protein